MQIKFIYTIVSSCSLLIFRKKILMEYPVCAVPAAPIRKNPSHKVEMVNQLLFGETMEVLKSKHNWLYIQSSSDNYEGWIRSNLVKAIETRALGDTIVTGDLISTITIGNTEMHIPVGSTLARFSNGTGEIADLKFQFKGLTHCRQQIKPDEQLVIRLTTQWLNAPYLWGGRTPLGVDCSGFVQVIFKLMGIDLLRDARLQAGQGIKIKSLKHSRCGDLAFFRNNKKKLTHVGVLLSPSQIIHASGRVRIDNIDEKGIINAETKRRSHG